MKPMTKRAKYIWTALFVSLAAIAIAIAYVDPEFLPLSIVAVATSISTLGTVWFYKVDRSAGVFSFAAGLFGLVVVWLTISNASVVAFVVLACIYGLLVASQPMLALRINAWFAKVDTWSLEQRRKSAP